MIILQDHAKYGTVHRFIKWFSSKAQSYRLLTNSIQELDSNAILTLRICLSCQLKNLYVDENSDLRSS